MSLKRYRQKRSFDITREPTGGRSKTTDLLFVIQKHAASHLHYDFRLEMEGVLKSWAVPKGPSTDPEIKRLAMMVEDHPYDYHDFEGLIPKGQYGGGTVIVWDEGTYEPADFKGEGKKELEKRLLQDLRNGKLKLVLHGKKLKGLFALVKASGRGENSWLLMKLKDKYATTADITKKTKSVQSGKTIEQVAATSKIVYSRPSVKKEQNKKKKANDVEISISNKGEAITSSNKNTGLLLKNGLKKKMPANIRPMLATLIDKPFDKPGWLFEVKWDGYRALAIMDNKHVDIKSRNGKLFNEKFYPIYEAVKKLGIRAVVDGEIVAINEKGKPDFGALQNWRSEADGELIYYVFDMIWFDGKDLTRLPLIERKEILKAQIPEEGIIRLSNAFDLSGLVFFETARKMGLEGIIAKRKDSLYHPGDRTGDWLKIKSNKRQEVVIGGYTKNDGSSKYFSSLLVGVHENGNLHYIGKVGTGFNIKNQFKMLKLFKPLIIKHAPFDEAPDINKPSRFRPHPPHATVTWLKPQLVCEVSYAELTSDGIMRHPSFEGMREDKKESEVVLEKEIPVAKAVKGKETALSKKMVKPAKGSRKTFLNPHEETQVRTVAGHELKFSNLSKIYWPKEKVTKRDMLNYYYQAAPFILPYLKGRPQSLNRHPNGILGKSFYQKDVTGKVPEWVETFPYHSSNNERDKHFLVCTDEATLLYIVSLGCIELNPWSSRIQSPNNPDWCVIDLDPDKNSFEQVIEAAQTTKAVLDEMQVPSFCKTSGSTGLHIYIPLNAKYTYDQSKEFARVVVTIVHNSIPTFTTLERSTAKRSGKMYLDFLQNRSQATIAAPYSLRPKPGAPVSMPLHWDEVKPGLKMKDFNIFNTLDRLKNEGDIFKGVLGKGVDLLRVIKKMESK